MFHSIIYKRDLMPYVCCKQCQKVFHAGPVGALDAHIEAEHPNAFIKPDLLEKLIREKDPKVTLCRTQAGLNRY